MLLPGPISALRAEMPDASIRVHDVQADAALEPLRARKADFALTTADPMFQDLSYEEVMRDRFVLLSAQRLKEKTWSEAALNELAVITMPRGSSTRHYIDAAFLKNNMHFRPSFELNDLATIASFVRADCGVALLPYLGARLIQEQLSITELSGAPERSLGIVARKGEELSPLALRILKEIRKEAKALVARPRRRSA
jgi:DNA-binding transcriptional LysR family regulator